jgi:glyoxylase-like metal-dependent hydrolase (beta-lactamase superfamily II)
MTPGQLFPDSSAQQWREQREMLVPDHLTAEENAEENIVRVAMQTWALRSDGRTILIDTGVGNDKSRPALPAWDHLSLGYLENLAAAGVRPEDVGLVINTRLHADHVGWNTRLADGEWVPTFPNGRTRANSPLASIHTGQRAALSYAAARGARPCRPHRRHGERLTTPPR